MKKIPWIIPLTIIYLAIGILTLSDYGFTWDFHHHFFAGANFLGYSWKQIEPRPLPYGNPDGRNTIWLPYGPLISIIPVASFLWFHRFLPDDVSYHLPIVIVGAFGPLVLYMFLSRSLKNRTTALIAAVFLALTPRYFADIHNDMKDAPMAVVFAINVWLLWRLATYRRFGDLLFAAVGFAIAFSTKVNAIFIPILFGIWQISLIRQMRQKWIFSYFLLAPLAAYALWAYFWPDPIGQLKLMFETFGVGTNNIEVVLAGTWYCSGVNVPWFYPYWYLAITTPLPILLLFPIGLIGLISQIRKNKVGLLLILWFFVPLTRYLSPKTGVIDGIRHFEEVVFPIAAIAAVGATNVFVWLSRSLQKRNVNTVAVATLNTFLFFVLVVWLVIPVVRYHPYQIIYFNELVGGARGAMGRYDLDYWGSSQKKAIEWINKNVPQGKVVSILMAPDVAGVYLRPDLLAKVNSIGYETADYVVVLNRQSFFYRYFFLFDYLLKHQPIHTISMGDVPLVWIYDNTKPLRAQPLTPWWTGDDRCINRYW